MTRLDCQIVLALLLSVLPTLPSSAADVPQAEPILREENPILIQPTPLGDVEYRPGRGLKVGDTGLTLGGFSTITATRFEGDHERFRVNDLDLFVFIDPKPYFHIFADFALDEVIDRQDGSGAKVPVERLYGDLNLSDRVNFRLGKFLTPVGLWNPVPAEPLTWTTSRPVVTDGPFDDRLTGGELWGSLFLPAGSFTYTLYGHFLPALTPDTDEPPPDEAAGARLELAELGGWSIGASYFAASREGRWDHLGGVDGLWRSGRVELSGEFLAGRGNPDGAKLWGLYLQAAVELVEHVHAVGRYEHFDPEPGEPALDLYDVGLAWRPLSFLILKVDYLFANRRSEIAEAGLHSSVSVLF